MGTQPPKYTTQKSTVRKPPKAVPTVSLHQINNKLTHETRDQSGRHPPANPLEQEPTNGNRIPQSQDRIRKPRQRPRQRLRPSHLQQRQRPGGQTSLQSRRKPQARRPQDPRPPQGQPPRHAVPEPLQIQPLFHLQNLLPRTTREPSIQ